MKIPFFGERSIGLALVLLFLAIGCRESSQPPESVVPPIPAVTHRVIADELPAEQRPSRSNSDSP